MRIDVPPSELESIVQNINKLDLLFNKVENSYINKSIVSSIKNEITSIGLECDIEEKFSTYYLSKIYLDKVKNTIKESRDTLINRYIGYLDSIAGLKDEIKDTINSINYEQLSILKFYINNDISITYFNNGIKSSLINDMTLRELKAALTQEDSYIVGHDNIDNYYKEQLYKIVTFMLSEDHNIILSTVGIKLLKYHNEIDTLPDIYVGLKEYIEKGGINIESLDIVSIIKGLDIILESIKLRRSICGSNKIYDYLNRISNIKISQTTEDDCNIYNFTYFINTAFYVLYYYTSVLKGIMELSNNLETV